MRYLLIFMFLVAIFVLGSRSCGSDGWSFNFGNGVRGEGSAKTESRTARDFHVVEAKIPGKIEVRVADEYAVEVQAQENLLPLLVTEVTNGALHIYFKENVSNADDLLVRISGPSFDGLSVSGSGEMDVLTPLSGNELYLSIGGSGSIRLPEADMQILNCNIAGSGDVEVGGKSKEAYYEISGSGDIMAKKLVAGTGKANIAGSGSITCNMTEWLKANIAGSGDILYAGAGSVETSVAGSGTVKKVE
ncbi:MAG: DUF2807 domain-containing protein [Lewinellaceae bacterium]|nr:DUF2807 domain-containing protein [Lewinellaceae bacterium]